MHRQFFIVYSLLITVSVHVAADKEDQHKSAYSVEDSVIDLLQSPYRSSSINDLPDLKNQGEKYKDMKNSESFALKVELQPEFEQIRIRNRRSPTSSTPTSSNKDVSTNVTLKCPFGSLDFRCRYKSTSGLKIKTNEYILIIALLMGMSIVLSL